MDRWWKDNNRNGTKEHRMEDGKMEASNEELTYRRRMEDGRWKGKGFG